MDQDSQQVSAVPQVPPPGQDLLEWVVAQYFASKIQSKHILNYNGANLAYTHAVDIANKLGLTDRQKALITPFPSPVNLTVTNSEVKDIEPPSSSSKTSIWDRIKWPLLVGLIGSALVPSSIYGAYKFFAGDENNTVIEQPEEGSVGYSFQ